MMQQAECSKKSMAMCGGGPPPPPSASVPASSCISSSNLSTPPVSSIRITPAKLFPSPFVTKTTTPLTAEHVIIAPEDRSVSAGMSSRDLSQVPRELDTQYERLDTDNALRPTIITPVGPWTKVSQASLLAKPTRESLDTTAQATARGAAFDLLDALSRSGALPMDHAALHVVMGATHCFAQSLMDSVVQKNINPIEKAERSMLIMATTLHQCPAAAMVQPEHVTRLTTLTPHLFLTE